MLPRIVAGVLGLAAFTWAWFGIAGRATWWQGWAFLLTFIIYVSMLVRRLSKLDPELVREFFLDIDDHLCLFQTSAKAFVLSLQPSHLFDGWILGLTPALLG